MLGQQLRLHVALTGWRCAIRLVKQRCICLQDPAKGCACAPNRLQTARAYGSAETVLQAAQSQMVAFVLGDASATHQSRGSSSARSSIRISSGSWCSAALALWPLTPLDFMRRSGSA